VLFVTNPLRIVTFGEAMIRLTPPGHERLERTTTLNVTAGGSELNVAVTAVCLDHQAAWISALPDSPLGRMIIRAGRSHGVDMNHVPMLPESAGRAGVYFLEEGTDPRPSAVYYDRARSVMAQLLPGQFNWPALLDGADALMVSGITPALGGGARTETSAAMQAAKAAQIPVFFDLNYRSKLWSEDEAKACFGRLVGDIDIMFASGGALRTFFGVKGNSEGESLVAACRDLGLRACVTTLKQGKNSRSQHMAAMGGTADGQVVETDWTDVEIVDRVGGGDAFAGGFIVGYLEQPDNLRYGLELGLAASALKHTMAGDFLAATRSEIEAAITAGEGGALHR
jgi:2-dehydro-3-deoxygluconokinase